MCPTNIYKNQEVILNSAKRVRWKQVLSCVSSLLINLVFFMAEKRGLSKMRKPVHYDI